MQLEFWIVSIISQQTLFVCIHCSQSRPFTFQLLTSSSSYNQNILNGNNNRIYTEPGYQKTLKSTNVGHPNTNTNNFLIILTSYKLQN